MNSKAAGTAIPFAPAVPVAGIANPFASSIPYAGGFRGSDKQPKFKLGENDAATLSDEEEPDEEL